MKNIFKYLLLAVMVLNTAAFAKNTNIGLESLEKTLESYKKVNLDGDMEKTLDFIYPAVFKIQPKEALLASFKRAKDAGKMPKISALDATIKKPFKTYKKGVYTLIDYSMNMSMDMTPPVKKENKEEYAKVQEMLNNPEKLNSYKEFLLKMMKPSLGKGAELNFEKDTLVLNIKKVSTMLAIKEGTNEWKFVEPTPATLLRLKDVLPAEIVKNETSIFTK